MYYNIYIIIYICISIYMYLCILIYITVDLCHWGLKTTSFANKYLMYIGVIISYGSRTGPIRVRMIRLVPGQQQVIILHHKSEP